MIDVPSTLEVIFILCPGHQSWQLQEYMKREGFTTSEEIEPKCGCRRFRLTFNEACSKDEVT